MMHGQNHIKFAFALISDRPNVLCHWDGLRSAVWDIDADWLGL